MGFKSFKSLGSQGFVRAGSTRAFGVITAFGSQISGTYTSTATSGDYTIYHFIRSGNISFTGGTPTIYILSVAGGGSGGSGPSGGGGGGGAGGMVQQICSLTTNNTLNITVGAGGVVNANGENTTVNFSADTNYNISCIGGGYGGITPIPGNSGGSGGGSARDSNLSGGSGTINQGKNGGTVLGSGWVGSSGGGGAGLVGGYGGNGRSGANTGEYTGYGGDGLLCTLNGISGLYSTYYWAGGGGGANGNSAIYANLTPYGTKTSTIAASTTNSRNSGDGGLGGGGAGAGPNAGLGEAYGGVGFNNGGDRAPGWIAGDAGANTGGGGGGGGQSSAAAGIGGSGIVLIAILTSSISQ